MGHFHRCSHNRNDHFRRYGTDHVHPDSTDHFHWHRSDHVLSNSNDHFHQHRNDHFHRCSHNRNYHVLSNTNDHFHQHRKGPDSGGELIKREGEGRKSEGREGD